MTRTPTRSARATVDAAMSEESLLLVITEALTLFGWRWSHVRRSDRALTMGHKGLPDVVAARKERNGLAEVLFIELKSDKGQLSEDQWAWRLAIPAYQYRLWGPVDLDAALEELR